MSFWSEYTKGELEYIDIKNLTNPLGLTRGAWQFSRGAKTERHYTKNGVTYIKVFYTYSYPDDGQGGQDLSQITSYSETIYLLEGDGSIFHIIPVPISLNSKNIKETNRAIRFGRLDYMYHAGEQLTLLGNSLPSAVDQLALDNLLAANLVHPSYNTPELYLDYRANLLSLKDNMELLFAHYSQEIYDYKDRGVSDFWDAVHSETDSVILGVLNTDLPPDHVFIDGFKIIDAIKYQLRGVLL